VPILIVDFETPAECGSIHRIHSKIGNRKSAFPQLAIGNENPYHRPFMRFLVHGTLSSAAIDALNRHGHSAMPVADLLGDQVLDVEELLKLANQKQMDVMTTDKDLATRPFDTKHKFGRAIIYLQLAGGDVEQDDAIDRLFARYKAPKPGQLYTVTETRVKVRQLPGL
jgi:hypothetical protein